MYQTVSRLLITGSFNDGSRIGNENFYLPSMNEEINQRWGLSPNCLDGLQNKMINVIANKTQF
jgi:hypothetical protein